MKITITKDLNGQSKETMGSKNLIIFFLLILSGGLAGISYLPEIFNNTSYYNINIAMCRIILAIAMIMLFFIRENNNEQKNVFSLNKVVVYTAFFLISELSLYDKELNINYDLFAQNALILLTIFISQYLKPNRYCIITTTKVLVAFLTIISLHSIKYYNSSFALLSGKYTFVGKNAFALFPGLCLIAGCVLAQDCKKLEKIFWICVAILNLYFIVVIRCRAVLVSSLVSLLIFYLQSNGIKFASRILIVIVIANFIVSDANKGEIFERIVYNGNETHDISTADSGRTKELVEMISSINLFLGNGEYLTEENKQIHCYVLRVLSKYGLIGGLPFVLFLFELSRITFTIIKQHKNGLVEYMGAYLFCSLILHSFAEPNLGNYSTCIFYCIYLGVAIRYSKDSEQTSIDSLS